MKHPTLSFTLSVRNASQILHKTSPSPSSFQQCPPPHQPWHRSHTSQLQLLCNHLCHSPTHSLSPPCLPLCLLPYLPLPLWLPIQKQTSLVGTVHVLKVVPSVATSDTASMPVLQQKNMLIPVMLRLSTDASTFQLATPSRMTVMVS